MRFSQKQRVKKNQSRIVSDRNTRRWIICHFTIVISIFLVFSCVEINSNALFDQTGSLHHSQVIPDRVYSIKAFIINPATN